MRAGSARSRRRSCGFDREPHAFGVALARGRNQRAVHQLARHGDVAASAQCRVEALEERLDGTRACQPIPERPDRLGVRNTVMQAQP